ncbi:uncharacterized protein METZ01_LOCUS101820 [marine metagenome]|uniref:LamG-like jellyroll fold domain-containing protein n=1 Tax=marine metagenome TaxID=408172 RepID=A0A381W8S6_9ZZZZ
MRYKKTQEGMFIALFALATVVIIGILVSYMSNWVNDMVATQTQVFFSKQAYWNTYSGMEIATSKKIASLDDIPNADVSFSTGTITIARTTTANEYLGGNKVSTITSTGSDLRGRSRAMKLTIGNPAVDYALLFDGNNDYVTMGDVHDVGTSDFTISTWFRYSATENTLPQLVNKYNGGMGYGLEIVDDGSEDDGKIRAFIKNASARINALSTGATAKDGDWHHVVATWDRDGNLTVYLDGIAGTSVSINTQSGDDIQNALAFVIGAENNHTAQFFKGFINDVAFWTAVLNEAQVQTLYIQGFSFSATNIANEDLAGYWNFNDQTDPTDDVSSSNNTGDISGAIFTGT